MPKSNQNKKFTTEEDVRKFVKTDVAEMLKSKRAFIVTSFDHPGVKSVGHRVSGRHYLRAAVALLQMSGDGAPVKIQHHISQALCELRQIAKAYGGKKQ